MLGNKYKNDISLRKTNSYYDDGDDKKTNSKRLIERERKKRIFHSLLSSEFAANWGWPLVVDKLSLDSTIVAQVWQKKSRKVIPLGTHFSRQKKK